MTTFIEAKQLLIKEFNRYCHSIPKFETLLDELVNMNDSSKFSDYIELVSLYYTGRYNYINKGNYILPKKLFEYELQ